MEFVIDTPYIDFEIEPNLVITFEQNLETLNNYILLNGICYE